MNLLLLLYHRFVVVVVVLVVVGACGSSRAAHSLFVRPLSPSLVEHGRYIFRETRREPAHPAEQRRELHVRAGRCTCQPVVQYQI